MRWFMMSLRYETIAANVVRLLGVGRALALWSPGDGPAVPLFDPLAVVADDSDYSDGAGSDQNDELSDEPDLGFEVASSWSSSDVLAALRQPRWINH